MLAAAALLALAQAAAAPDALFERAHAAQLAGDFAAAEAGYREYLKIHRPRPEVLANLGVLLARQENYREAVGLYEQALRLDPKLAQLNVNLGLAYLKQGQPLRALPAFDRFLAANPAHRQTQQLRAMALLELSRFVDSERQYRALAEGGQADLSVTLGLATALLRQRKVAEARAVLDPVLARGDSPELQLTLGQALLQEGRVDEAFAAFEQARALNPKLPLLRIHIGSAHWQRKRSAEALAEWRAELAENPQSIEAAYMLGAALALDAASREEAVKLLRQAVALRPRHAFANYQLGKLMWQSSRNDRESLPFLQRATEADAEFREAFFLYGTVLQAAGRKAEAARAFARVKEISARDIERQRDLFSEPR